MRWLPAPVDFDGALRAATAIAEPGPQAAAMVELARYDLSFIETLRLDKAFLAADAAEASGLPRLRLALLASSTLDHLLAPIRVAGLRHGFIVEARAGSYGQYRQELLNPDSWLHRWAPDFALFSQTAADLAPPLPVAASGAEVDEALDRSIDDLRGLWALARQSDKTVVVQQTLLDTEAPLFGSFDRFVPAAPAGIVAALNARLAAAAREEHVLLLDVAAASARDGLDFWFDVARWLQGKLEVAPGAAGMYGELLLRILAAQRGRSRKCLVLDLDNTLWGGVVGDDGPEGLALGQGSAVGEAHLNVQMYAQRLRERGVVLAVCSKNDAALAERVFDEHPDMILQRSEIACFVANWCDKAENLVTIAQTLNLGLDSLVFVDDNPAERERVRSSLPEVAVPELPDDPAHFVRCIAEAGYFEAVAFTTEDAARADQYAANSRRENLRRETQNLDTYLAGLEMRASSGPVDSIASPRAAQLLNKTNQFNTTGRRFSEEELAAFLGRDGCEGLCFRLSDRFGDNGLVSVILLQPAADDADALQIENWVMSCRVFGRQLEDEVMNAVVGRSRALGVARLEADYRPTERNRVIEELYPRLGFSRAQGPGEPGDVTRWRLELDRYRERPTFIERGEAT